ncbi:MAG: nucleotidyl transferase AbiEii/AbiGii toxin family protein [Deltaproteobacteria bacterium]|nr:nucleotidyl transferase AbiEii/AbiGii toxin family protein [Deltaproteobacteria bacterium]
MASFKGVHTMCGLSNISYGLPERRFMNQVFMAMAIAKGLDGAIINPLDKGMMANIIAAEALIGRDEALERFLYRLAQSGHAKEFVLKGAMLFTAWTKELHRPTKDLVLLGHGNDSGEHLQALFQKICQVEVEPDGLVFDESTVRVEEIRGDQEYQGERIRLTARLGNARIPVQIDVAFGDVITPEA